MLEIDRKQDSRRLRGDFPNIANYVYSNGGDANISISIDGEPAVFMMTFADSGVPFNPLLMKSPDINAPLEERPIGGLGIYMVRRYMDEVSYEYKGSKNILILK